MKNSISNDSIWGKLSEIDEKLEKVLSKPQESNSPSLSIDELLDKIGDNSTNFNKLDNDIQDIKKAIDEIPIPENIDLDKITALFGKKDIFHFGFIKFRKTSFIITILGILIFILTIFSMKLYNDSLINQNNYYKQITVTRKLQIENDTLKAKVLLPSTDKINKKRR